MASGNTTGTVQCPECTQPLTFPVRLSHRTNTEVAVSADLTPVHEHIAGHQTQFANEPPATVRLDNSKARYVPSHPLTPIMGNDQPMTTYDGPATATADGTEHDVTARLTISTDGHLKEWRGSIVAETHDAAAAIHEASTTTLRTHTPREGVIIVVGWTAGSTELIVQGSGPAPFGD